MGRWAWHPTEICASFALPPTLDTCMRAVNRQPGFRAGACRDGRVCWANAKFKRKRTWPIEHEKRKQHSKAIALLFGKRGHQRTTALNSWIPTFIHTMAPWYVSLPFSWIRIANVPLYVVRTVNFTPNFLQNDAKLHPKPKNNNCFRHKL